MISLGYMKPISFHLHLSGHILYSIAACIQEPLSHPTSISCELCILMWTSSSFLGPLSAFPFSPSLDLSVTHQLADTLSTMDGPHSHHPCLGSREIQRGQQPKNGKLPLPTKTRQDIDIKKHLKHRNSRCLKKSQT